MSALVIPREKAIRYARVAHGAAAALLLAAGAIAFYGLPWADGHTPSTADYPLPRVDTIASVTTAAPVSSGVDFTGLSHRLALIDNAPKPAEAAPQADTTAAAPAAPPAEESPVRFLGAIIEPDRRVALLFVNGRQRAVLPGQTIKLGADEHAGTLKVVSIDDDAITIEDKQGKRTIQKAARTGSVIANISPGSAPSNPQPPQDLSAMDPAIRAAREAGRGLDPEKRRQLIDEARRLQAENRARRDRPNGENE